MVVADMVIGWLGTPSSNLASGVNILTGPEFLALKIVLTVVAGLATVGLIVVLILAYTRQSPRQRREMGCLRVPWSADLHVLRDGMELTAGLSAITLAQLPLALAGGGSSAAVVLVLFTCLYGTAATAFTVYYGVLIVALSVRSGRCRAGYFLVGLLQVLAAFAVGITLTLALLIPMFDMTSPLYGSSSSLLAGSLLIALVVMAKLLVQARESAHMVEVSTTRAEIVAGLATLAERLETKDAGGDNNNS
jgi:hypothetical protein